MDFEYKLILNNDGVDETETSDGKLAKTIVEVTYDSKTKIKHGENTMYLSLAGLDFHRKVYEPGSIDASVHITVATGDALPAVKDLHDIFLRKIVTLRADKDDMATNYYVHKISPRYKNISGKTSIYVGLAIHSLDNLMRLNKFSQAYLGRKLRDYIVASGVSDYKLSVNGKEYKLELCDRAYKKDGGDMLLHLSLDEVEFIQPYLVQYNESFYDFVARVCNRCGEFMFFENGKLHVGLDKSELEKAYDGVARTVTNYESVTYQYVSGGVLEVEDYTHDTLKYEKSDPDEAKSAEHTGKYNSYNIEPIDDTGAYPDTGAAVTSKKIYNDEVSNNEFFMPLYRDEFSGGPSEVYGSGHIGDFVSVLLEGLGAPNVPDKLSYIATSAAKIEILSAKKGDKSNKSGNNLIDTWAGVEKDSDGNEIHANMAAPFVDNERWRWTTLRYYGDIRSNEEAQQREMVCVDMGAGYQSLRIGDVVKLPGDDRVFVVVEIEIHGDRQQRDHGAYCGNIEVGTPQVSSRMKFYAVPAVQVPSDSNKGNKNKIPDWVKQSRYAASYKTYGSNYTELQKQAMSRAAVSAGIEQGLSYPAFYPPVLAAGAFRQCEPQHAIVIDSGDPKQQGRVRVRYPWQRKVDESMLETDDPQVRNLIAKKATLEERQQKIEGISSVKGSSSADDKAIFKNKIKEVQGWANDCQKEITEQESKINELTETINGKFDSDNKLVKEAYKQKLDGLDANSDEYKTYEFEKAACEKLLAYYQDKLKSLKKKNESEFKVYETLLTDLLDSNNATDSDGLVKLKDINDALGKQFEKNKKDALKKIKKEIEGLKNEIKKMVPKPMALLEAGTPWIRMVTPMATKGGGMYFKPEKGDEVMVDFENGNIERPFVAGTLYSKNVTAPGENRVIMSPNGHFIKMSDPTNLTNVLGSVSPGFKFLKQWNLMPSTLDMAEKEGIIAEKARNMMGGITLSDGMNFCQVDISAHNRKVTVQSTIGNVEISALTGITVSAPHGDVKIEGKNVSITAGNRLTLTSGKNIGPSSWKLKDMDALGATVVKRIDEWAGGLVDMSFLRCIVECLLAPVNGTLQIKSHSFLKLEAGDGRAEIPVTAYKEKYLAQNTIQKGHNDSGYQVLEYILRTIYGLEQRYDKLFNLYDKASIQMSSLCGHNSAGGLDTIFSDGLGYITNRTGDEFVQKCCDKMNRLSLRWPLEWKKKAEGAFKHPIDSHTAIDEKDMFHPRVTAAYLAVNELYEFCNETATAFSQRYGLEKYDWFYKMDKWSATEFFRKIDDKYQVILQAYEGSDPCVKVLYQVSKKNNLKVDNFLAADKAPLAAGLDKSAFKTTVKKIMRRLCFELLNVVNDYDILKGVSVSTDTAVTMTSDDDKTANWGAYVDGFNLDGVAVGTSFVGSFVKTMQSMADNKLSLSPERDVWSTDVKGQILMSESAETMSFNHQNAVNTNGVNSVQIEAVGTPKLSKSLTDDDVRNAAVRSLKNLLTQIGS